MHLTVLGVNVARSTPVASLEPVTELGLRWGCRPRGTTWVLVQPVFSAHLQGRSATHSAAAHPSAAKRPLGNVGRCPGPCPRWLSDADTEV